MITLYREKGGPLTPWEVDQNFITMRDSIKGLTGLFIEDYFLTEEGDLTFRFNDGSMLGPIRLPTKALRPRGQWRNKMVYIRGDFVTDGGSSYYVHLDHQAESIEGDLQAGRLVVLASRGDDAAFPEPPADGTPYARQDGAWIAIVHAEPAIAEDAPADGKDYVRRDGSWKPLTHPETTATGGIGEAPDDGKSYVRSGKAWAVLPAQTAGGGTGIADAPVDGTIYGRRNGEWVVVPAGGGGAGGIEDAPENGRPHVRQDGAWIEMPAGDGGAGAGGFMTYRGVYQGFQDYAFGDVVKLVDESFWLCIKAVGQGGDTPSIPEPGQQSNASWRLLTWPGPEAQFAQGGSIRVRTSGSTIDNLATIVADLRKRIADLEAAR